MEFRIGQGIDIHPFVENRDLVLGGVKIPSNVGLAGHSDADVLLHALIDSILGAAGMPDLGHLFPNTEAKWKGASSLDLLSQAWKTVSSDGWCINNADMSILAEEPKISPYISEMKKNISSRLACDVAVLGIKASTAESLGFVGRKEGIFASAVVLLVR